MQHALRIGVSKNAAACLSRKKPENAGLPVFHPQRLVVGVEEQLVPQDGAPNGSTDLVLVKLGASNAVAIVEPLVGGQHAIPVVPVSCSVQAIRAGGSDEADLGGPASDSDARVRG